MTRIVPAFVDELNHVALREDDSRIDSVVGTQRLFPARRSECADAIRHLCSPGKFRLWARGPQPARRLRAARRRFRAAARQWVSGRGVFLRRYLDQRLACRLSLRRRGARVSRYRDDHCGLPPVPRSQVSGFPARLRARSGVGAARSGALRRRRPASVHHARRTTIPPSLSA